MKHFILTLFAIISFVGCSKDDNTEDKEPTKYKFIIENTSNIVSLVTLSDDEGNVLEKVSDRSVIDFEIKDLKKYSYRIVPANIKGLSPVIGDFVCRSSDHYLKVHEFEKIKEPIKYYDVVFKNISENAYYLYLENKDYYLKGGQTIKLTLKAGVYKYRVVQDFGYLLYPTIENNSIDLRKGNIYESFPYDLK